MSQPDIDLAKQNMILNQIRSWGVLNERVLELLNRYPRERFVEPAYRGVAYADTMLPLTDTRMMLSPSLEGRLLETLNPGSKEHVLVVGTGSGYLTALIAACCAYVTSVETDAGLVDKARVRLQQENITNVQIEVGDATVGWPNHAPYDAILIVGAVAQISPDLIAQLQNGGRLVGIEGVEAPVLCVRLLKQGDQIEREELFETEVAYLENAAPQAEFVF